MTGAKKKELLLRMAELAELAARRFSGQPDTVAKLNALAAEAKDCAARVTP